jgi:hypothetical protein
MPASFPLVDLGPARPPSNLILQRSRSRLLAAASPASPTQHTEIHLVDSSGERTILKSDRFLSADAFTPAGVLLMDNTDFPNPAGQRTIQLKLLDPATGKIRAFPYPPPGQMRKRSCRTLTPTPSSYGNAPTTSWFRSKARCSYMHGGIPMPTGAVASRSRTSWGRLIAEF